MFNKQQFDGFVANMPQQPQKVYSQTGEEGILEYIFSKIGTTNNYLVDFGAGDGIWLSNSKFLMEQYGFTGLRMDGNPKNDVVKEFLKVGNVLRTFKKHGVPVSFDLLSVDMDGNDYWVLKEILRKYKPRVIVAEFNGCLPHGQSMAIKYDPDFIHKGDDYYGASFLALQRLCTDYVVVHELGNLNMFMVRKDIIGDHPSNVSHRQTQYHPHNPNGEWVYNPENLEM